MSREETSIPNIEFTTATGNFDTQRQPITQIIIHSTVGTVQSAINRFGQTGAGVSAHYIIGNNGALYQGLEEYYTAYHSGKLDVNRRSIGIEHEWYQGMIINDELYKKSAMLVADICKFYGLGCNRGVVKGHKEIVATGCPNQIDVDRIVREAQAILTPDDCQIKLKEMTAKYDEKVKLETFLRGEIGKKDTEIATYKAKLNSIKSMATI